MNFNDVYYKETLNKWKIQNATRRFIDTAYKIVKRIEEIYKYPVLQV